MSSASRKSRSRQGAGYERWTLALALALLGCRDASRSGGGHEDLTRTADVSAAATADESLLPGRAAFGDPCCDGATSIAPKRIRPTSFITVGRLAELEALRPGKPEQPPPAVARPLPTTPVVADISAPLQPLPKVVESSPTAADEATANASRIQPADDAATRGPSLLAPRSLAASDAPAVFGVPTGVAPQRTATPPQPKTTPTAAPPEPTASIQSAELAAPAASAEVEIDADEAGREIRSLLAQSTPAATGAPTGDRVNHLAMEKLHKSNQLVARGANFAARAEVIEVLHMIADAKDAIHGSNRRAAALTAGLCALDEAEDFTNLPAAHGPVDEVALAATGHATPLAKHGALSGLAPSQAVDVYLRFAQLNLGAAVAGEPAGSMALHALGKLHSLLAATQAGGDPLADRRAFACQQAALLAREDNYLAAHELGVLLAESGHYREAEALLRQVAVERLDPVVLRNLARVNQSLGRVELASQLHRRSLAIAPVQQTQSPVRLVAPEAFVAASDRVPAQQAAMPAPHQAIRPTTDSPATTPTDQSTPWYLR